MSARIGSRKRGTTSRTRTKKVPPKQVLPAVPSARRGTTPVPRFSEKRPLKRGVTVRNLQTGTEYIVVRCVKEACVHCGSVGYNWNVRLTGEFRNFTTTLHRLSEMGYVVEEKENV